MPYWNHHDTWGWGWFGAVMVVVSVIMVCGGVGMIVYLTVHRVGTTGHHDTDRNAERILDERFARGEIDEDELTARRAALRREVNS